MILSEHLSAPIYRLKREAKLKARAEGVPLHEALDAVARVEGYASWSLLSAKMGESSPALSLFKKLVPGDLVLVGARQGHGKTLLAMELIVAAMRSGKQARLFTLEYTDAQVLDLFAQVGEEPGTFAQHFSYDNSDDIEATYIATKLAEVSSGGVVVIDYLQALDQDRTHAPLEEQVSLLKEIAKDRDVVMVFIAQIDRKFDSTISSVPQLDDVRLPNPLDLALFDKACFLHDGEMQLHSAA